MAAAFPPVGWWWSGPVAVACLIGAVRGASLPLSWLLATAAHGVLFLPLLEWVRFLGVVPWLALAALQAVIGGLVGPLVVFVARTVPSRPLWRAVGWVGAFVAVEALRARAPFEGLTWGRLAFGQSDGPLLPLAALGGAPLVSAAVALAGVSLLALADALRRPVAAWRPAAALGALLAAATAVQTPINGPLVEVAAVQGNVPPPGREAIAEDLAVLDNHVRETERLAREVAAGVRRRPALVVWPENASDQDPRTEPLSRERVERAVRAVGQPILLGAVLRDPPDRTSNALLVWGPNGPQASAYRKKHLVPFGEYLPLRRAVEALFPQASSLLPKDFSPGRTVGLLQLNGVPVAAGTCFEVAFDDLPREAVRAGGQILVLPSNNASYGRSAQSAQQLAMARLRAVEHGRSTVVATTSGISALIRPDGRVVARSRLYEPAVLQAALPRRDQLTLATRHGARVEAGLAALLLAPVLPLAFASALDRASHRGRHRRPGGGRRT